MSVYSLQTAPSRPVELLPRSSLFGHRSPVTSLAVAKSFGTFVSVSGADGVACLWDLNRLEFIRRLSTGPTASGGGGGLAGRRISIAKMNDTTGDILLCCGPNVLLFTLNGELILDQNVCGSNHGRRRPQPQGSKQDGAADAEEDGEDDDDDEDNIVHAATFYEGAGGTEWLENYLLFTGHHRGVVNVWRKTVSRQGRWVLEWLRRLDHVDPASESGANYDAAITCITALPQHLYTGDEDGRVVS